MHAPQIKKKLLSVSKLTSDNNLNVEFDVNCCVVKDEVTGLKLLEGT